MLTAIKKTRIPQQVVNQIHELIRHGNLKAGDQLPSERELAETLQVSRASIREAIRTLEAAGLVVTRTGMGTFVADLPSESLVARFGKLLSEEKHGLVDIFELRKLVEPWIAALAAERATRADLDEMRRILAQQGAAVGRGESGVEADSQFHFAIGQATQNEAVKELISALMEILSHSREESLQTPERRQASLTSHQEILLAITMHDRDRARRVMLSHIQQVERNVLWQGHTIEGSSPEEESAQKNSRNNSTGSVPTLSG